MKRTWVASGVVLLALALGSLVVARDSKAPVTGTWEGVAHASDGDEQFTMTLEQAGDDVKGSISTQNGGQLEITSGSFKKDALEIHCETADAKYVVTGKLKDGQLSGDWSKAGSNDSDEKGTWEAKKSQAKPAQ